MNEAKYTETRMAYGHLQRKFFQDMLRELGSEINSGTLTLDFGCCESGIVYDFRKQGFKAFRVDIEKNYESAQKRCEEEGLVEANVEAFHLIDMSNYKVPSMTILLMLLSVIRFLSMCRTTRKHSQKLKGYSNPGAAVCTLSLPGTDLLKGTFLYL